MSITSDYNNQNHKNAKLYGKIPPQALDVEEALLGAIIIDKKGLEKVIDYVFPDIFYHPIHKEICKAIQYLFNHAKPIDLITVSNYLKNKGKLELIGGDYYLIELSQKVISSAHVEYYARIIQEKFLKRSLIKIFSNLINKAYDDTIDIFELLNTAENKIFTLSNSYIKKNYDTANILINKAIDRIKEIQSSNQIISGVPSGFHDLDAITSGWQKSDLVILAARPGMGKTAFILSMARNIIIDYQLPVAFFSLEMSSIQLINRLISSETGIPVDKLRKAQLSDSDWFSIYDKTKALKNNSLLFIDDSPNLSIFELRTKCRNLVSKHDVKVIMVDYLQLMVIDSYYNNKKFMNREQEISIISRNLKSIAKELDIPIIALSQLSRAVEIRGGNKRPMLSDLRESGAIEQDADIVGFIYRPDYYGFSNWNKSYNMDSCKDQAEIIIAKHRNGSLNNIRLKFISNQAKFINFL
jgi:replicative DNA helicase